MTCDAEKACGEIRRELDARLAESDWIPVSERLPAGVTPEWDGVLMASERVVVRVFVKDAPHLCGVSFGQCLIYNNGWDPTWRVEDWNGHYDVSHWFPIPPLPPHSTGDGK